MVLFIMSDTTQHITSTTYTDTLLAQLQLRNLRDHMSYRYSVPGSVFQSPRHTYKEYLLLKLLYCYRVCVSNWGSDYYTCVDASYIVASLIGRWDNVLVIMFLYRLGRFGKFVL